MRRLIIAALLNSAQRREQLRRRDRRDRQRADEREGERFEPAELPGERRRAEALRFRLKIFVRNRFERVGRCCALSFALLAGGSTSGDRSLSFVATLTRAHQWPVGD